MNKQLFIILFLLFVPALSWGQTSNITGAEDTAKLKEVIVTDIHSNKDLSKTVLNISKIPIINKKVVFLNSMINVAKMLGIDILIF